jgi:hypothetical protein
MIPRFEFDPECLFKLYLGGYKEETACSKMNHLKEVSSKFFLNASPAQACAASSAARASTLRPGTAARSNNYSTVQRPGRSTQ